MSDIAQVFKWADILIFYMILQEFSVNFERIFLKFFQKGVPNSPCDPAIFCVCNKNISEKIAYRYSIFGGFKNLYVLQ